MRSMKMSSMNKNDSLALGLRRLAMACTMICLGAACTPSISGGVWDAMTCENACPMDSRRCHDQKLEVCAMGASGCLEWSVEVDCLGGGDLCDESGGVPACVPKETCSDGILNQDETDIDCAGVCSACAANAICKKDVDCKSGRCDGGKCAVCIPKTFSCLGNTVQKCADDGWSWVPGEICDVTHKCDASAGTCGPIPVVGKSPGANDVNVTGAYFKYARFTKDSGLKDYCFVSDVDSYKDIIYVHAVASPCPASYGGLQGHIDVYRVALVDTDKDGKLEPNQHPDNPKNRGPVEERVLTYLRTLKAPIGPVHHSEIYATEKKLYFPGMDEIFVEYDLASEKTVKIVDGAILKAPGGRAISVSGYDEVNKLWYFASEYPRRVFSYDPKISALVPEFDYPDMSGDHMDGMAFVPDPNNGKGYLYVTDMTSDYIGQYSKDATGKWTQTNLFHYGDPDVESVEGMGFGALDHFWVGGRSAGSLYELGGGDLGKYVTID